MLKQIYNFYLKNTNPIKYAKKIGVTVGNDCRLLKVDYSSEPYLIVMGNHVSATKVRFETHDGGVWVLRHKHPQLDSIKRIQIGNNVFIGYGSIVLPGTTIGDNIVIGAGSIVRGTLESGYVYAGVPVRKIKSLEEYEKKVTEEGENTKHLNKIEKKSYYLKNNEK